LGVSDSIRAKSFRDERRVFRASLEIASQLGVFVLGYFLVVVRVETDDTEIESATYRKACQTLPEVHMGLGAVNENTECNDHDNDRCDERNSG
jgi:hypothetical protein